MAGPLAWGFLGFGILVILGVAAVLINAKPPLAQDDLSRAFQESSGWKGYIHRVKLFSRNARLYMIHVVGMDVIYGTWSVMFNLYLLGIGFDVSFIGLRILVASIASAVVSIPAGVISDRIGRKLSFI